MLLKLLHVLFLSFAGSILHLQVEKYYFSTVFTFGHCSHRITGECLYFFEVVLNFTTLGLCPPRTAGHSGTKMDGQSCYISRWIKEEKGWPLEIHLLPPGELLLKSLPRSHGKCWSLFSDKFQRSILMSAALLLLRMARLWPFVPNGKQQPSKYSLGY